MGGHHHSILGRLRVQANVEEGPGYLVAHQEAVRLVPAGTGTADGTVTALASTGAHTLVRVALDAAGQNPDSHELTAEVAGAPDLRTGHRTGVLLDSAGLWVVPG